ncbi:hypothetical protein D3C77_576230 [compost metagenome]
MKNQIIYLCDSGAREARVKPREQERLHQIKKPSIDTRPTNLGANHITWQHVKMQTSGIYQPWYTRLEQYRG